MELEQLEIIKGKIYIGGKEIKEVTGFEIKAYEGTIVTIKIEKVVRL